ncbi:calcium/sodium antiporter [Ostreibacterium oceani]|uniref:Calcium/sodium antiporter n=1 Tax=Ostreibacterium oceani TaxID=2654998 RepID=A0A6N7EY16_9GAMM|nr:calcium/sodium antiporter [Ostreibacterium oceani]MPV85358.1 calcium/sodium antiporter [Ostreibacterium oceani]
MLINGLFVVVGLVVLIWSADRFIDGASATARHFGMPALLVGMLIVGFGTSAPELAVSALASLGGNSGIAVGNAYGSNIANIGLVLAITALIYPLSVSSRIVRREIPWLLVILLLSFAFFYDREINRIEAAAMFFGMFIILIFSAYYGNEDDALTQEITQEINEKESTSAQQPLSKAILSLGIGLLLLLISSHFLVKGAVAIAQFFGLSDLIIGLTIIAIGTSLPELASAIAAAKKNEPDIVLGNIIGSCLFNSMAVVGLAGMIKPMTVSPIFLQRDFVACVVLTIMLWVFAFGIKGVAKITRKEGGMLLAGYIGYSVYLLMTLQHP